LKSINEQLCVVIGTTHIVTISVTIVILDKERITILFVNMSISTKNNTNRQRSYLEVQCLVVISVQIQSLLQVMRKVLLLKNSKFTYLSDAPIIGGIEPIRTSNQEPSLINLGDDCHRFQEMQLVQTDLIDEGTVEGNLGKRAAGFWGKQSSLRLERNQTRKMTCMTKYSQEVGNTITSYDLPRVSSPTPCDTRQQRFVAQSPIGSVVLIGMDPVVVASQAVH